MTNTFTPGYRQRTPGYRQHIIAAIRIAGRQPVEITTHGGGPGADGSHITAAFGCHLSQYLAHFGLAIWRSLIELSGVVDRLPSCCRSSRACRAAERKR